MNKKNIIVVLAVASIYLATSMVNRVSFGATFREGVFEVTLPSSFERASKAKYNELRKSMMGGSRELARDSKLINPSDISEKGLSFLSVFQDQSNKLTLVLMGMQSPNILDRDGMNRETSKKIKWGIDSGRLSTNSKVLPQLSVNGIPCLLHYMETKAGSCMKTCQYFVTGAPNRLLK